VVLGCNIHDHMIAYVYVVDSPHFAKTGRDGMRGWTSCRQVNTSCRRGTTPSRIGRASPAGAPRRSGQRHGLLAIALRPMTPRPRTRSERARALGGRLQDRIVVFFVGLLIAVQAVSFFSMRS
jgi:hypothetical protein